MPSKTGKLTASETAVVQAFAETESVQFARMKGQYRSDQAVYQALQRPAVQAEIRKVQLERLHNDLLPAAVTVLRTALDLDHAGVPWGSRITAAKIVTDRVFNDAQSGQRKDVADMTADELKDAMQDLQSRLANMAKPIVDATPAPTEEGAFE